MTFTCEDPEFGTEVRAPRAQPAKTVYDEIAEKLETAFGEGNQDGINSSILNKSSGPRIWNISDDVYYEGKVSTKKLPSGLFEFNPIPNIGVGVKKIPINTDELIVPPEPTLNEVLEEFKLFWSCKQKFIDRGILYKRGFLLWGPPGGGKTSLIALLNQELMKNNDGVILNIDHPATAIQGLQNVRKIEPERPLILIIEDIDALIERYGEPEFLSLLDGENHIENVVAIATTNYPERLDSRFVNRPSRFDKIIKLDMPNPDTRRMYLQRKEKSLEGDELDQWVTASKDFSLAHLKEMIVAVKCLDQPFDAVVERLSRMKNKPKSSAGRSMGFTE